MTAKPLLICNFSGGRTSSFMALYLKNSKFHNDGFDIKYVFANTGKEKEETLEFIQLCEENFDISIVWIESVVNPENGKGTTHKIVNFVTASRSGEPFEEVIKKYSMPNAMFSHCTRELKKNPIHSYGKSLGYKPKDIYHAIGIRADEKHRLSNSSNIIYPMANDINVDKQFIRHWWDKQSFDLRLKDYEGNCDLCFKKSMRKRMTLIKENPNISNWWEDIENKYGIDKAPYFDMRNFISIKDIKNKASKPFETAKDDHKNTLFMDYETECFCKSN